MGEQSRYLLGHEPHEWQRLEAQHALWGPVLMADLLALGLRTGDRVLEVGCGTGAVLEDLVSAVGSDGRVEGLERDPAAAAHAQQRLDGHAVVHPGDLAVTDLGGPWDWIVARWVFSFLPQPEAAVHRLAAALAPGGRLLVHDYNHDGIGIWPRQPVLDGVIEAYRAAYRARGGDLFVAAHLPGWFQSAGLGQVTLRPHVKAGSPGSPVWAWVERFVLDHLHTLEAGGQMMPEQTLAVRTAWAAQRTRPGAVLFSPQVVTVVGQRPHAPSP